MSSKRWRSGIPPNLRGAVILSPWIVPWFGVTTFILGIPGARDRGPTEWFAIGSGLMCLVVVSMTTWAFVRHRSASSLTNAIALTALSLGTLVGSIFSVFTSPDEVFQLDDVETAPQVRVFLAICLAVVWFMTWLLVGILVAGQISYRASRRALQMSEGRIETFLTEGNRDIAGSLRDVSLLTARKLQSIANSLARASTSPSRRAESIELAMSDVRSQAIEPLLASVKQLTTKSASMAGGTVTARRKNSQRLRQVPRRWNGVFFSGSVGALLICIVAISAGVSPNLANSGILVQVPLVALAFFVSVPSALILFFAATLTPLLTSATFDAQSLIFTAIIALLALASFAHRANEVRQLRVLETTSRANADMALETVRARQRVDHLRRTLTSLVHGNLQGALVSLETALNNSANVSSQDVSQFATSLRQTAKKLANVESNEKVGQTFSVALQDLIEMWQGAVDIKVTAQDEVEEALSHETHLVATILDVLGEATTNAVKHGAASSVKASLSTDGRVIRIVARSPRKSRARSSPPTRESSGLGLTYLRELTSLLELRVRDNETVLIAEIPRSGETLELTLEQA